MNCEVCQSPIVTSFHFGGKACKACAAFFRRVVCLNVRYICSAGTGKCVIHHEKRINCKYCRFKRCLKAKMQLDMVQGAKMSASDLEKCWNHVGSLSGAENESEPSSPENANGVAKMLNRKNIATQADLSIDEPSTSSAAMMQKQQEFDIILELPIDTVEATLKHYLKLESDLNKRRAICQTKRTMSSLFCGYCKLPFDDIRSLPPFDYKTYNGYQRFEYAMIYDYVTNFPFFNVFNPVEQITAYRQSGATDIILNCAYYTSHLGFEQRILITNVGQTLNLNPMPLWGTEPGASELFESEEDFQRYKLFVSTKRGTWERVCVPIHHLKISFEEHAILKAIIVWHSTYYKLETKNHEYYRKQRDLLLNALFRICTQERSEDETSQRFGDLIMVMSSIYEEINDLIGSVRLEAFFGYSNHNEAMTELLHPDWHQISNKSDDDDTC